MKVKIGIIGTGRAGITHLEAVAKYTENTELVAITGGPIEFYERAKGLAEKYHIDCERSFEDLIGRKDIDAVLIDTPNYTHCDLTLQAAEAGKHVFVEIPMATTLEECDKMINTCRKAGVKLMVGHHQRFRKGNLLAKKLIDEGKIGKVFMMRETMVSDSMGIMPDWLKYPPDPTNLGILVGPGTHCIDRANWFIDGWGKVDRVCASCGTFREKVPIEASSMVLVKYKHGVTVSFWVSFEGTPPNFPHSGYTCQVMGTEGLLDVDPFNKLMLGIGNEWKTVYVQPPIDTNIDSEGFLHRNRIQAYADCVQDFVNSIIEDREPSIGATGEQDKYNIAIALAAYKSSRSGEAVKVPIH